MNFGNTPSRIRWTTLLILFGVALLLSALDSTGNLGGVFDFIRNPLTAVADWTAGRTDAFASALSGPRDLQEAQQQITDLEARNAELERELEELREIEGEWRLLQDLFNRARQSPELQRQTANVIGLDTSPAVRSIIIDKGSADGLRVGMPVESARGLVGRIFRTAPNSAQVILITDNASSIPVRLGTSRATGNLTGGGTGGVLIIDWIDLKFQVEVGEVVLTSGLGGDFAEGLIVGRVIEVVRREAELFQQAVVQPATDLENLEIVFVITDFRAVDTSIFNSPLEDN